MSIEIGNIKLFSVEELADILKVTPSTIRIYCREGRIKGRKFGVKWYIPEESLKEYFCTSKEKNNFES